ncbi:hypothetical protein V8D89_002532 [Ganoderma adspersum]
MSARSLESSGLQSQFLKDDENVLVLTKARFFRTLRILLDYAQHPERRTWEFFSYRPWDYILNTFCLTFDLDNVAKLARLEYAQPDFALMSNGLSKEGQLLFLGEAKPLGSVEPDTIEAHDNASHAFLNAEFQRQRQARLAFERHSESDVIKILMICGSFWSVWTYERSDFSSDLPPSASDSHGGEIPSDSQNPPSPTGLDEHDTPSPDRSPPHKLARTDEMSTPSLRRHFFRRKYARRSLRGQNTDEDAGRTDDDDPTGLSPVSSPQSDHKDFTWRPNPQEEPLETDTEWDHRPPKGRKAGKKVKKTSKAPTRVPSESDPDSRIVHHILQLPGKDALNPWFCHFLSEVRDTLVDDGAQRGNVQSSWFDWTGDGEPDGNGHAPGYVLPKATGQPVETEFQFVEVVRVHVSPEAAAHDYGSPLSQAAANALLTPRLSHSAFSGSTRTPAPFHRFGHFGVEEDTVLPQLPEPEPEPSDDGYDTTPSPTDERRDLIPTPQHQPSREPSPIGSYLERKQQDLPQRQPDSTGSAQPLPPQSLNDFASREDRQVSESTAGDGASAQTLHDHAPLATSTPVLPSSAAAGDSRPSATDSGALIASSGRTTRLSDKERRAAEHWRKETERLLKGPLLAERMPNGDKLPKGFSKMSRSDQETMFVLAKPRSQHAGPRDREAEFRSTGLPERQVEMMMTYLENHGGGVQRGPDESLTTAMPPPPPPITTSLPRSAEGALRRAGGDDAQSSGLRPVSGEGAGPSTTTTDAASRTHAGSRVRTFDGPGAAPPSSRSAGAGVDDGSHSFAEPAAGSLQAAIPPRRQRRGDPVATTTAHMETLNLGRPPSGTDLGEGSSNRKRKDRQ